MDRSGVAVIYELNFIFLTAALWNLLGGTQIQLKQPYRFPNGKREIFFSFFLLVCIFSLSPSSVS